MTAGALGSIALLLLFVACSTGAAGTGRSEPAEDGGAPFEAGERIENAAGKIVKVGDFGYGIVPDVDPGTRYAPSNLAEEFQEEGLRVRFSGTVEETPRGVRLWGIPLRLSSIERLEP